MRKEIADRWVAALRSGTYPQGRGMLKADEGYCCYGVLALLAAEEEIRQDMRIALVSSAVKHWAGFKTILGTVTLDRDEKRVAGEWLVDDDGRTCLVSLNDAGAPFSVIADIIENHWERL